MWSSFTFFAGRRGEVVWKKSFRGRGRRDYDTHVSLGLIVPFVVLEPLHTFYWGQFTDTARAISLNPERGFRLRAYLHDWSGILIFVFLFAAPLLAIFAVLRWVEQSPGLIWYVLASLLAFSALIGAVVTHILVGRLDHRDQDIRLLLGTHTWGSSDPAYWHPDLLEDVKTAENFRVKTFAALARRSIAAEEWCQAMWAARVCSALEDEELGEKLTTQILDSPDVRRKLPRVRRDPSRRVAAFGEPPPLSTWVRGIPEQQVFTVG